MTSIGSAGAMGMRRTSVLSTAWGFLLRYGAFIAIIGVCGYFALLSPVFLTADNGLAILKQGSALAIAAFGLSVVIIGGGTHIIEGGIDLSIGAQVGLATAVYATLMVNGFDPVVAILAGVIAGTIVGLLNGLAIAFVGIVPLLATLGTQNVVAGAELLFTNNVNVPVQNDFISGIADGAVLYVPVPVIILAVTFVGFWLLVERTPFGVQLRAVGGNRQAAVQSGIPVRRLVILSYMLASVAAAISAVVVMGRLAGSVRGIGDIMLLDILLAAYVSAMFSRRWIVNIPGTLIGALLVAALTNGFTLVNIPGYWVLAVKGALILFVVSATSLEKKRRAA